MNITATTISAGWTKIDNDSVLDRLPEIDGTAMKVFLALARRANGDGKCWPSQMTIAVDTGIQPRAVRGALVRLRELGLVGTENNPGHATTYVITPAQSCRPNNEGAAPQCLSPRHDDAGESGTAVPTTPAPPCLQNKNHRTRTKNKIDSAPAKRFVPPTIEEVRGYCHERKNGIDAQHFLDYHQARGWKLKGGQAVKDWRACVRTWEHNGFQTGTTTTPIANEPPRRVFQ